MNLFIESEFLNLLESDRLRKLKEIERELATISVIKSKIDPPNLLAASATAKIGQKRKSSYNLLVLIF